MIQEREIPSIDIVPWNISGINISLSLDITSYHTLSDIVSIASTSTLAHPEKEGKWVISKLRWWQVWRMIHGARRRAADGREPQGTPTTERQWRKETTGGGKKPRWPFKRISEEKPKGWGGPWRQSNPDFYQTAWAGNSLWWAETTVGVTGWAVPETC